MDDLISRQAAIDALDVLCQEHRYKIPGKSETYSEYNEAWQDALDRAEGLIFNLPSAQPQDIARDIATIIENEKDMRVVLKNAEPQWIPVSERLPEDGLYIVTTSKGQVQVHVFSHNGNSEEYWMRCNKAWMPLPEPYKGEQG